MKVLQIINSLKGGGAEKIILDLHTAYLEKGIDSHVLTLGALFLSNNCPNVYDLGLKSPYELSAGFRLYRFLHQARWKGLDIIHVHLFPAQIMVAIIYKILRLQSALVTTEHSTYNRRRKNVFGQLLDKYFYGYYDKIVCISNGAYYSLAKWQPNLIGKMSTIYNGINIRKYPNGKITRNYNKSHLVIISVGRLVKLKNYETAIRAVRRITNSAFEYWIVGEGPLESSLKDLVVFHNCKDKIKFLGFRTDIPKLLQQADMFLLTSFWEGFGLVVVEAMAAGLPVVVSNVPGVRELVGKDSDVGFLVHPKNESEICNQLSKLTASPELRLRMGNNAQYQASQFDIQKTVNDYLQLYDEIRKKQRILL